MSDSNVSASRPSTGAAAGAEADPSRAPAPLPVDPGAAPLPDRHSGNQMSPAVPLIGILVFTFVVILWGALNH